MIWLVEGFLRVSVTPGMTAPVGSVTTPWIEVRNCATALEVKHSQMIAIPLSVRRLDNLVLFIFCSRICAWLSEDRSSRDAPWPLVWLIFGNFGGCATDSDTYWGLTKDT